MRAICLADITLEDVASDDGTWHHVALVRSCSGYQPLQLFVNGTLLYVFDRPEGPPTFVDRSWLVAWAFSFGAPQE